MAAPTDIGSYGAAMYDRLGPLAYADEQNAWAFLIVCGAIGAMHQPTHELLFSEDPNVAPYGPMFDVDAAPVLALRWLAQLVGERVPAGETEDLARDRISSPQGLIRGTIPGVVNAAQRTLTGTKNVLLIERDGSEWRVTVVTSNAETPGVSVDELTGTIDSLAGTFATLDPSGDVTNRALQAAKPAGIRLTHAVVTGTVTQQLSGTIDALSGTIDALSN